MFLTKKSFFKIVIMAICYFVLGSISIALWVVFNRIGVRENFLFFLGITVYFLGILMIFWGRYAEGKGKLINLGNKLVRQELNPAEFIQHYESLKNSNDLITSKPAAEVLQFVAIAYDSLDDKKNVLETVDEMINVSSEKKKNLATLIKASFLFSYGQTEEAEQLFNEVQKQKLDLMSQSLVDTILKSDRAMAMGDYATVETYTLKMLERTFPKLDNLGKLAVHYKLGEVYEKLQDTDKAVSHYQYCAVHGGETAMRKSAIEKLQDLT